ncbi:short-chain dehydrogenase/reductase [Azospirillum canadense]|uniref:short-chain dehydrogenase/reductase n=1 Tax=Azospirillum canadense TaxID=403962 RepID=UPI0022260789|nr:short-chain dehydrogenase/reductase [Azospirillum canadense]MCW2241810.1 NAD(P)-dependent dehydrogenase (short-subunit alcohol dehydrogenase family) [Azospirillum canadense]
MDLKLAGKRVLITGASQGIGEALAEAFAEEGCALHLVARSAEKLNAVAARLGDQFQVPVAVLPVDITAPGAVETIAAGAQDVDVLVNNAGAIPGGNLWEVGAECWRRSWDLKVFGYIDLVRAIYPRMKARGGGVILNNIGSGGENFDFDYVAGSAGNAALMAFTRSIGGRSLDDGIRVLGVNPGRVATERLYQVLQARSANGVTIDDQLRCLPMGRPANAREIADLFVFLASPRSAYTSGAIFTVDGGMTARRSI